MFRSWKIANAFDIGIYVHSTFLLLPAWVVLSNWGVAPFLWVIYSLVLLGAVFGCVVLHELGHALMARQFGIATRDITLYPIGGVARLERMSEEPLEEIWIALAGPAVNVVIAALLVMLLMAGGMAPSVVGLVRALEAGNVLVLLLFANVMMVLFNLLPVFPMDGGRVLRALLAMPLGHLRATEIAAGVGTALGIIMFLDALWTQQLFGLGLVALFVIFAGQQELAAVRDRAAHPHDEVIDVYPAEEVYDAPIYPARQGFSGFTWDSRAHLWVEWRNGRPIHRISVE